MKFTELYPVGHKLELGTVHFSAESIIRYAEKFDPQPFHLSEEGAKNSVFEVLCASGWQTSASWMKCFLNYWTREVKRLTSEGIEPPKLGPSPGIANLKWCTRSMPVTTSPISPPFSLPAPSPRGPACC